MLHSQALPTATRALSAQVGAGVSLSSPDYSTDLNKGISAYGDVDLNRYHVGLEVDFHDLAIITPHDIGEITFLAGVRYVRDYRRFRPYAKVLAGVGTFEFQQGFYTASSSGGHMAFAIGGGSDYVLKRKINIRIADFEYQHWNYGNGLTPWIITVGAAYHF